MHSPRIIPVLTLRDRGLVKTLQFGAARYVGDPINAVKVFNQKEVDELVFLDLDATREGRGPDLEHLEEIASECFMPFAYGGGIRSLEEIRAVLRAGAEKVALNSAACLDPALVRDGAARFGRQSIIVSVDVRREQDGYAVFHTGGRIRHGTGLVEHLQAMARLGAGEFLVTSIDRDGTCAGYDLELVRTAAAAVDVPVIACGGARGLEDFRAAVQDAGAAAAAAGSHFVFCGPRRGVLITYPERKDIVAAVLGG
jgi:cyclase